MSNIRLICLASSVAVGTVCGIADSLVTSEILTEVNMRLPESQRFSESFWHPGKLGQVISLHSRFFPDSNLRIKHRRLVVASAICLLTGAASLIIL